MMEFMLNSRGENANFWQKVVLVEVLCFNENRGCG